MNAILGGWQFQTINNFRSGVPWTPTISTDVANIGVTPQHPNVVAARRMRQHGCANQRLSTQPPLQFPPPYTYGNSGFNICYTGNHQ